MFPLSAERSVASSVNATIRAESRLTVDSVCAKPLNREKIKAAMSRLLSEIPGRLYMP